LREVPGTQLQRVINTRAILLFDDGKKTYYLRVKDWWLEAPKVEGPWTSARRLSDDMKKAEEYIVAHTPDQGLEGEGAKQQSSPKQPGQVAETPVVHVVFGPTELIETKGEPQYKPIPGNGTGICREHQRQPVPARRPVLPPDLRTLVQRRFAGRTLDFVNGKDLPPDFAKIPTDSPKGTVLASVPGTSASEEALIANSIPQTATITRAEAKLTVKYDGEATFAPIEGTSMQYAKNTSAAVVKVSDGSYYSVEAGVWFKASTPQGTMAHCGLRAGRDLHHTAQLTAPLRNVCEGVRFNAGSRVRRLHAGILRHCCFGEQHHGGLRDGMVLPAVHRSSTWYGWPYTYGVGAGFTYSTGSGWSFGFGYGYAYYPWYYPWWGPMSYYGYGWYPYYGWGAWGGAAAANVYGVWGNTAYSRTGAAWANPYTGNYGAATRGGYHNNQTGRSTVAGRGYNTNVYTGNTGGYRGAATYNPNTGIVAGGGAGYLGNVYSGQGAAGRGGFAYNTNTGAGIAGGSEQYLCGKRR
jgi:hypothetical protein